MSKNERYLTCFYLMRSIFNFEQDKQHALNCKNAGTVKDLTVQISQLQQRINNEFSVEQSEIENKMFKDGFNISGLNEMWLIENFGK